MASIVSPAPDGSIFADVDLILDLGECRVHPDIDLGVASARLRAVSRARERALVLRQQGGRNRLSTVAYTIIGEPGQPVFVAWYLGKPHPVHHIVSFAEILTLAMSDAGLDSHVVLVEIRAKAQGLHLSRLSIVVTPCVDEGLERREARRQVIVPSLGRVDERQRRNGA